MPKFLTTADYKPTNFSIQDYHRYQQSKSELEHAQAQLKKKELKTSKKLSIILNDLIKWVEEHPDKEVPIFVANPTNDNEYPLKYMLPRLKAYVGKEVLTPEMIIEQINILIEAYTENRLDYNFNASPDLKLQHKPKVLKANATGRNLKSGSSEFMNRLNAIKKTLTPYQKDVMNKQEEFKGKLPKTVCTSNLNQALQTALDSIYQKAHIQAQNGNNEAAGIRGVCEALKQDPNKRLEKLIKNYNTLKARLPGGYADQKLVVIQGILEAHKTNRRIIHGVDFNQKTVDSISMQNSNRDKLLSIINTLKDNINNQKNERKTSRNSEWKSGLLCVIQQNLLQLEGEFSVQEYIQEIRDVCSMKRNALHFWKEPHSASEFEKLLEENDFEASAKVSSHMK